MAQITRSFTYVAGYRPAMYEDSTQYAPATTDLVERITFSDGRTLTYTYDNNNRITKVVDSVAGTTEYTYDAQGQLLTETQNGVTVNTMTYGAFGNITKKNGVAYSYHGVWKDKLVSYGNREIVYDEQGNPTNYLGHSLTWEKGRQLKSCGNTAYTYNKDGIRTGKTVNGVAHTYLLEGSVIL